MTDTSKTTSVSSVILSDVTMTNTGEIESSVIRRDVTTTDKFCY
jgi:hypothetical protein